MSKFVSREFWRLFWAISLGLISGLLLDQVWLTIVVILFSYLIWLYANIFKLSYWVEGGLKRSQAPNSSGVFENIIANIYRLKTSKKRGKKKLAQLLGQFRASAEALPDATVILTSVGEIQWFNEAAESQLGLQSPRDIGQRIDNLIREPEFKNFLYSKNRKKELRLISSRNESVTFAYRLINYGKQKMLLTARDVSLRERIERVRQEFVSNASHELRTPLTVIRGYLEIMSVDKKNSPEARSKMHLALQQTEQMETIIHDMLTLSRLENSSLAPGEGEPVNISRLLNELVDNAISSGKATAGQIQIHANKNLCLIAVRSEIESISSNLLYNALQHNPEQTPIELQWFENNSESPCLVVSDQGQGIEQQHLDRLTERFYRVDTSRSRASGGTGLGLAIVKHIVQRHGGYVELSSSPEDGSSFSCCFPTSRAIECMDEDAKASH